MEEIEVIPGPATGTEVALTAPAPLTFSELYEREFLPLVKMATLMTGRVETARDIVQDAFVKLHVKWSTVRDPLPYVRRSVMNGCRSYHRREGRRRRDESLADQAVHLDVDLTMATLRALSHKQRAMVILKFYEQCSEAEIAEIVGCRPGSVGPTIHRALATLRTVQT